MSFIPIDLDNQLPIRVQQIKFSFVSSHWHNSLELLYITDGSCRQLSNGREVAYHKGNIIINNAMVPHELKAETECKLIAVQFPYLSLEKEYSRFCPDIEHLSFAISNQDHVRPSYRKLCNLIIRLNNENQHWQDNLFSMCAAAYEILQILTRHYKDTPKKNALYLQDDESFLNILSYIQKSYKEKITREKIGLLFGYSPKYVSQLFSRKIHTSLQNFVNQLRLENAYNELLYSDKTITYIAEGNGFSSLKYFNKCFKDAYRLTPKEFRSKYQQRGAASKKFYTETRLKSGYDILHMLEKMPEGSLVPNTEDACHISTREFDFSRCRALPAEMGIFLDCRDIASIFDMVVWENIKKVQTTGHYQYALLYIPAAEENLERKMFLACRQLQSVNLKPCFIFSFSAADLAGFEKLLCQIDQFVLSYKGTASFDCLWGIDVRKVSAVKQIKTLFSYSQKYLGSVPGIVLEAGQADLLSQMTVKFPFSLCYVYGRECLDAQSMQQQIGLLDMIIAPDCQKTPLDTSIASLELAMAAADKAKSVSLRLDFEQFEMYLAQFYAGLFLASFKGCRISVENNTLIGCNDVQYLALSYEKATKPSGYLENYGFKVYNVQSGTYCISTADIGPRNGNFVYNLNVQRENPKISQYILSRAEDLSRPVCTMEKGMMNADDMIEVAMSRQGIHFMVLRKYI